MKIKMIEKNEGHWIYRQLEAFGYTISNKSSDKKLVALKSKDTGVDTPPESPLLRHSIGKPKGCPPKYMPGAM